MNTRFTASLLFLFVISYALTAQNKPVNRENFRLRAIRTDQAVQIDDVLEEDIWTRAEITTPFFRIQPVDTGYAQAQTEVMVRMMKLTYTWV